MNGANAYLVNTGWIGGAYGVGNRIDLPSTRAIINSILDGSIENAEFVNLPIFNLATPKAVNNVDSKMLNPQNAWSNPADWENAAKGLGQRFINNFQFFTDNDEVKALVGAGPQL